MNNYGPLLGEGLLQLTLGLSVFRHFYPVFRSLFLRCHHSISYLVFLFFFSLVVLSILTLLSSTRRAIGPAHRHFCFRACVNASLRLILFLIVLLLILCTFRIFSMLLSIALCVDLIISLDFLVNTHVWQPYSRQGSMHVSITIFLDNRLIAFEYLLR